MFEKFKDWLYWKTHAVVGVDLTVPEEHDWAVKLAKRRLVLKVEPFEGRFKWGSGKPVSEKILITSLIANHFVREYARKFNK